MKRVKIPNGKTFNLTGSGISVANGYICFDSSYTDQQIKEICQKAGGISYKASPSESYKPSKSDKAKVQGLVKDGVDIENFGFYQTIASSSRIDTAGDRFGPKYLKEMAKQYKEGRVFAFMHSGSYGIGKTFDASVKTTEDGEKELLVKFYVTDTAKLPNDMLAKDAINTGIYDRTSVSLYGVRATYIPEDKSEYGRSYYDFNDPTGLGVRELSLVDMGGNPDARIKSATGAENSFAEIEIEIIPSKATKMDKYLIKILNKEVEATPEVVSAIKALEQQNADLQKKIEGFEAKQEEATKALVDRYVAANAGLKKDTTDAEKAGFKKKAELFSADLDLLKSEVEGAEAKLQALKQKQLDTKGAGEKNDKEEDNSFLGAYGF